MKTIILEDGDTLLVAVKTKSPSVFDPVNLYGSSVRAFRVVAEESETVLELVPVSRVKLAGIHDTERLIESAR